MEGGSERCLDAREPTAVVKEEARPTLSHTEARARPAEILRESDPNFVLLDDILAKCDRVGDSRADYAVLNLGRQR